MSIIVNFGGPETQLEAKRLGSNLDVLQLDILDDLVLDVVAQLGQVLDGGSISVVGHLEEKDENL